MPLGARKEDLCSVNCQLVCFTNKLTLSEVSPLKTHHKKLQEQNYLKLNIPFGL